MVKANTTLLLHNLQTIDEEPVHVGVRTVSRHRADAPTERQ